MFRIRYRHHLLFALLLSFPIEVDARPAVLRTLMIDGNVSASRSEILGWVISRPGTAFSLSSLQGDLITIRDQYRGLGFLGASTKLSEVSYSDDSSFADVTLIIEEGRQSILGSLNISGHRVLRSEEIIGSFRTAPGEPLIEQLLEEDIDALLEWYEELGFPFARCRVADARFRSGELVDSVDVDVHVTEGERLTIDEIRVEGNEETDRDVVVRETRIRPGELFDPEKVSSVRKRLARLNIFANVAEPELFYRGDRGGVLIRVQEGSTNTFDGVIGYVPPALAGEEGYVTGLVSIGMRNLFGTGRKLSLRWYREDRFSQELAVRYQEPWVLGFPVNLGGGFFQRQQDSAYVRRLFDLSAEFMLTEELSVGGAFGTESVIPSADTTLRRVSRSSTTTVGAELRFDSRDDPYSPRTGVRLRTDYHYGRKRSRPTGSGASESRSSIQRVTTDFEFLVPTFSRQVLALSASVRQVTGGNLEESDMFRLGGAQSLRGYRENAFVGSVVAWSNTEYRFVLDRRSYLFLLFDTGYYSRPSREDLDIPGASAFKFGYGLGIRLNTALGILGVSFALGQGDTFATGKIHIGLVNDF